MTLPSWATESLVDPGSVHRDRDPYIPIKQVDNNRPVTVERQSSGVPTRSLPSLLQKWTESDGSVIPSQKKESPGFHQKTSGCDPFEVQKLCLETKE